MVKYFSVVRILHHPNRDRDLDNLRRHLAKSRCNYQAFMTKEVSKFGVHHIHCCIEVEDEYAIDLFEYIEEHMYKSYVDKIKIINICSWQTYVQYMTKDIVPESELYKDYLLPSDPLHDFTIFCKQEIDRQKNLLPRDISVPVIDLFTDE